MEIIVENAVPRFPEYRFRNPVNWHMKKGENWAVVGPNGAGKTLFADLVQERIVLKSGSVKCLDERGEQVFGAVKSMSFRDIHTISDSRNMYYQQRWNSQDAEESPFASSLLEGFSADKIMEYSSLFGIESLLDKRIISLSSGELRKFLVTRVLMMEPSVLILDNPFIGLDARSRQSLDSMLSSLYERKGLQVVLVLSQTKDLPGWIDMIQPVENMSLGKPFSKHQLDRQPSLLGGMFLAGSAVSLPSYSEVPEASASDEVLSMRDVRVTYAGMPVLEGVDWKVMKGEKWALLGPNGSGKSTLLSLVCGDNPQGYANDLSIFGKRRGTGESIWDIKKRIGYLSPDMHTYYMEDVTCLEAVASGFFDSVGLFRKCTSAQYDAAAAWMECFGASHLAGKPFIKLSYGEQRLVLLVRAFVKNPELLILDEPLHGLDTGRKQLAKNIIELFCSRPDKTLIYVTHYMDEIPGCVTEYKVLHGNG